MSDLRFHSQPELEHPLVIAGFAGWNDAGEVATSAIRFIRRRWRAERLADIDPEEFYDLWDSPTHKDLKLKVIHQQVSAIMSSISSGPRRSTRY